MADFNEELCIKLLQEKHKNLLSSELNRFPKKEDFSKEETVAIKAYLGPWPRALEKAGIKEIDPKEELKKQEKRISAKRKKTLQKIESRKVSR